MESHNHNLSDRYHSTDGAFTLEYENTDAALPWRSHARLWIGRRSFLIPALFADAPAWDDLDESWYVPAWVVGHRQKIAKIDPEMRRIYLSEQDYLPFQLQINTTHILLNFSETDDTPISLNRQQVSWGKGRRF